MEGNDQSAAHLEHDDKAGTVPADWYVTLLIKTLTRSVSSRQFRPASYYLPGRWKALYAPLAKLFSLRGAELIVAKRTDPVSVTEGREFPADAETMLGTERLDHLGRCAADVLVRGVPGDFLEAGVWRGGACIFLRALLNVYGDRYRKVWLADSFRGLPKPDAGNFPADRGMNLWRDPALSVSVEEVKANFERYGLLDDRVRFLPGFFKDTLPGPVARLSILRLDGDMYESTIQVLTALYPKLSDGGYLIIDDFSVFPACRKAVADYRGEHQISTPIVRVGWNSAYWRKEA